MAEAEKAEDDAAAAEAPAPNTVDEHPGVPIPRSEEQARRQSDDQPPAEAAKDEKVAGATNIDGPAGGPRFFDADTP
jgi:hypothetical protein